MTLAALHPKLQFAETVEEVEHNFLCVIFQIEDRVFGNQNRGRQVDFRVDDDQFEARRVELELLRKQTTFSVEWILLNSFGMLNL